MHKVCSKVEVSPPRAYIASRLLFITLTVTAQTLAANNGEEVLRSVPLQRIGRPEDVAGTALYLASPASAYVNGATITLDGGYSVSMTLHRL